MSKCVLTLNYSYSHHHHHLLRVLITMLIDGERSLKIEGRQRVCLYVPFWWWWWRSKSTDFFFTSAEKIDRCPPPLVHHYFLQHLDHLHLSETTDCFLQKKSRFILYLFSWHPKFGCGGGGFCLLFTSRRRRLSQFFGALSSFDGLIVALMRQHTFSI